MKISFFVGCILTNTQYLIYKIIYLCLFLISWNTCLEERIDNIWTFPKAPTILWWEWRTCHFFSWYFHYNSRDWNFTYLVLSSYQSLLYSRQKYKMIRVNVRRRIFRSGKCHSRNCLSEKTSVKRNARWGNCPSRNYPSEKFLWVTVHQQNVRRKTALEPLYLVASLGSSIFWNQPVSFTLSSTKCSNILIMLIVFIHIFLFTLWC